MSPDPTISLCICGGLIEAVSADPLDIEAAVKTHNLTRRHRLWRESLPAWDNDSHASVLAGVMVDGQRMALGDYLRDMEARIIEAILQPGRMLGGDEETRPVDH